MADESGAPHNQSIEDRDDELVNEEDEYAHGGGDEDEIESEEDDEENYSEEDEYAYQDGDEDENENEIESEEEEEEEEDLMNEDPENAAEMVSSCGGEEDTYEEGLNRHDIDGLYCPICLDPWTNGGDHQVCCLPCGHIYGLSCIKTWIQRNENSRKCPQCKKSCSLQDIRVLYASRVVAVDDKLQKKVKWLEARCASMKKKMKKKLPRAELEKQLEETQTEMQSLKSTVGCLANIVKLVVPPEIRSNIEELMRREVWGLSMSFPGTDIRPAGVGESQPPPPQGSRDDVSGDTADLGDDDTTEPPGDAARQPDDGPSRS